MIKDLLEKAIGEVLPTFYKITRFELGKEPYELLKTEVESIYKGIEIDINKINHYRNIPVHLHDSKDAVMYVIQPKSMAEFRVHIISPTQ